MASVFHIYNEIVTLQGEKNVIIKTINDTILPDDNSSVIIYPDDNATKCSSDFIIPPDDNIWQDDNFIWMMIILFPEM